MAVAQTLIKQSGKILTVRSKKQTTYPATVPQDLEIPEDLRQGDVVFVEFKNDTPMVTGFELAPRETDEEVQARFEQEKADIMGLGGDY